MSSLFKTYRYYQEEADNAICQELLMSNKCLVKMFCGTGKSLLMRNCKANKNKNLVVYVFPSLNLINQFYDDYLSGLKNVLKISSDDGSTTNVTTINSYLQNARIKNKLICVTYQSFDLLLSNLGDLKIDICWYDEAHHAVGQVYQTLIFGNDVCLKQIFMTATPKNANGIVMYNRDNIDQNMCGKLVYDYSYLRGVNEGYLNPFEIRIDMYTDNTNKSVYECIARAIIASGNSRCLTFHSDVNTDRDTSVRNFVEESEFIRTFVDVLKKEFPDKIKYYKKVKMIALDASIPPDKRKEILKLFDDTPNNEVIVISSCETIGEGIDTKNANMCVFVDPKSSFVKITQNIGRIVRKIFGQDKPNSTILIPCWVDKTKYLECDGDKEKCDEVIRQDMGEGGNFNGILNVMSALKQEDEDLYEICLHYPDCFSPQEIENNLVRQGFTILDEDMDLNEGLEYFDLEIDEECDELDTNEELLMKVANDNDVCIEIHTNSLENPVEKYNSECESGDIVRMYKEEGEDGEDIYRPIVKNKCGEKRTKDKVEAPDKNKRLNIKVYTNPDVKVLWNVVGGLDLTKEICSCIIDCEVVKYDPMEVAIAIVERAKKREAEGDNLLPQNISRKTKEYTEEEIQETKDQRKLYHWRQNLKNKKKGHECSNEVKQYLDENLNCWRDEVNFEEISFQQAKDIVLRAKQREEKGENLFPKKRRTKFCSKEELQQHRDYEKLGCWKKTLNGSFHGVKLYKKVKDYLDLHLKGWNDTLNDIALQHAKDIVFRAKERVMKGNNLIPIACCYKKFKNFSDEEKQEHKDAQKLSDWKDAFRENTKGKTVCYDNVKEYLDLHLKGWNNDRDLEGDALQKAEDIVSRAKQRQLEGKNLLPRYCCDKRKNKNFSEEEKQEHKDAAKLQGWKQYLKGKGSTICHDIVKKYLDLHLDGWNYEQDLEGGALQKAEDIVFRAKQRQLEGKNLLPRYCCNKRKNKNFSEEEKLEDKDATKLQCWRRTLQGKKGHNCSDKVRDYLDQNLPGWREKDEPNEDEEEIIIIPKKSTKIHRQQLVPNPSDKSKKEKAKNELSAYHQKYITMRSDTLATHFKENPEEFAKYHKCRDENLETFSEGEKPHEIACQMLNAFKTKKQKTVVDMGCGLAKIANHFADDLRFKFINYDHVSVAPNIEVCDISSMPLEDDTADICIMCFALWGSNCADYVKQAYRVLETQGSLYIIDSTKRWSEKNTDGYIEEGMEGQRLKILLENSGFKIVNQKTEKFCLFHCVKI
jgi:superfamily II DNA or RNA helicase